MSEKPSKELSVVQNDLPAPSPAQMLQAVIQGGVTAENAAVMEKLIQLHERVEARNAEKEFNKAFVALQQEMPRVQAMAVVPNNDGTPRYKFAAYESIMEQVQPFLVRNGFTISFSTRYDGPRIVKTCILRHTAGHSISNDFAVRIGAGPPKANEAQADGAAGTYAKRHALCDALNIVVEKDNDANAIGDKISKEEAKALRQRVLATGSDEVNFLAYAQVKISDNANVHDIERAYEEISTVIFPLL